MAWVSTVSAALAAALLFGVLARRFGLSPIVGYLLAGIAVGPHTPGFVGNTHLASELADVGVILLMFGAGLGFSLPDLWSVRRAAIPGALLAGLVSTLLGFGLGQALGWSLSSSVVFGLCFTSASTVVIVRGLAEVDLLGSAAGRVAVGWSVVEDLIVVAILVVLPGLSSVEAGAGIGALATGISLALGRVALLAGFVFALGPRLVPPLLAWVARTGSRELFSLAVLVLAMGTAFLASEVFGTSLALGAFLGGMLVGASDSSHQAAADALPLRDAFAVLFFVAVGMLFDPAFVVQRPGLVLASLAIVLVGKPLCAVLVLLVERYPLRIALAVALGLAQLSEFAFVLANTGVEEGLLPASARDAVLSAVLLSITLNPLLLRGLNRLERLILSQRKLARLLARRGAALRHLPAGEAIKDHALVVGHGQVGSRVCQLLSLHRIPIVVIESDRERVESLRRQGLQVLFGDGGSPVVLDRAGIARARVLVIASDDPLVVRLATQHARSSNPKLEVIARVHSEAMRRVLRRYKHAHGVHGELELGLSMGRFALQCFGLSAIQSEASVMDVRRGDGQRQPASTRILEVQVPADSPMLGCTLRDLDLPRGSLVVTIGRDGEFVVPSGMTQLQGEDSLLLLASLETARAVEKLLNEGPPVAVEEVPVEEASGVEAPADGAE